MVEFIVLHDNSSTLKDTLLDVISEQHIQTISIVNDSQCCVCKPQNIFFKSGFGNLDTMLLAYGKTDFCHKNIEKKTLPDTLRGEMKQDGSN